MNAQKLTGTDYYEARSFIRLSISAVANATGINRNNLSLFEKEKATLTEHEKQKLQSFYEERGCDFNQLDPVDTSEVAQVYQEAQSQVKSELESSNLEGITTAVTYLAESVDELVTANHYLDVQEAHMQANFINYLPLIPRNEETLSLYQDYRNLDEVLETHFINDSKGLNQGKTGFFGESSGSRSEKLMAMLALQQLRLMRATTINHPLVQLNKKDAAKDSDMSRLLSVIQEKLDYNALSKELPEISSELVA